MWPPSVVQAKLAEFGDPLFTKGVGQLEDAYRSTEGAISPKELGESAQDAGFNVTHIEAYPIIPGEMYWAAWIFIEYEDDGIEVEGMLAFPDPNFVVPLRTDPTVNARIKRADGEPVGNLDHVDERAQGMAELVAQVADAKLAEEDDDKEPQ